MQPVMNVSNICPTTRLHPTDIQNVFHQRAGDFRALGKALRSGDLQGAQDAFAALQKDFQNGSNASTEGSQPFSQNTQAATDFQALQSALQSGDLSTAQKAFANLKTDLHGVGHAHRGHHHHRVETKNDGDADDGGQGTTTPTPANETAGATTDAVGGTLDTQA
jgi:hypothetical protein